MVLFILTALLLVLPLNDAGWAATGSGGADGKRLERMEIMLRQWLLNNKHDRGARFQLAHVLAQRGRAKEALDEYDVLLEENPDDPEILLEKADLLFSIDKQAQALLLLRKIRHLSPEYEDIYQMRYLAWKQLQEPVPAEPVTSQERAASPVAAPESDLSAAEQPEEEQADEPADVETMLLRAAVHIRNNEYLEALALYDRVLTVQPNLRVARIEAFRLLYLMGDYNQLVERGETLLKKNPDDTEVLILLAKTAGIIEQYDMSAEYYRRVLAIDPEDYEAQKGLVYVLNQRGQAFTHERKRDLGRADNLSRHEQYSEAENLYYGLLQENEKDAESILGLAALRVSQGDYEEAFEFYQLALTIEPDLMAAEIGIITVLRKQGKYQEALKKAQTVIGTTSDPEFMRRLMADLLSQMSNLEEAATYFGRVLQDKPDDRGAMHALAVTYRYQGRFKEAVVLNEELLREEPDNIEVLVDLGIMCNYLDKNKAALNYLQRARSLDPDRSDVRAMLYQLKSWYSRVDAQVARIQKRRLLDRNDVDEYLAIGRGTGLSRDVPLARRHYEHILESRPENTAALIGLGTLSLHDGRPAEAEKFFSQALEFNPASRDARTALDDLTKSRRPDLDIRFRSRIFKDYNPLRATFDRRYEETEELVTINRRTRSGDEYLFRYRQSEHRQIYFPLNRTEFKLKGNAFSFGHRRHRPGETMWWFRADSNSFRNTGTNHFNLAGTENQVSGFAVTGKQYRNYFLSMALKRDILVTPRANTTDVDVSTSDIITMALDIDARPDLSFQVSARHLGQTLQGPSRNALGILARYRPSIRENVQLRGGIRSYTNPKDHEYLLSFDLRDKAEDRLSYWLGYDVVFGSSRAVDVDTHSVGLLLDYNITGRWAWYFDGDYSFERRDDEDRDVMYQTGIRFRL